MILISLDGHSCKAHALLSCLWLPFPNSLSNYLTPIALTYRLNFLGATAILISESDDIVSVSSASDIVVSGTVWSVSVRACGYVELCSGYVMFITFSNTIWNSLLRPIYSCSS